MDVYRPALITHATTLAQRFLPRQADRLLDHVVLHGLAAISYLNIWLVDADTTDAALAGTPLLAANRFDVIPIGANLPVGTVPIGAYLRDAFAADGRTPVGGAVVSISSASNATGDIAAVVQASYRWLRG